MKAAATAGVPRQDRAHIVTPLASRPLIALAFEGLSEEPKELASILLYDAQGSVLFERICEQPEYYLSRAETRLLERHSAEIAEVVGRQVALVEYGSGSARKTRLLLAALRDPHAYVALDIDPEQLQQTCTAIRRRFRTLRVIPRCQDFRHFVPLPAAVARAERRVAFFSGSTIGNFRPLEAVELLNSMRETVGPGGALLVGVDLVKDPRVLERAYNDAAGVTAAFNLNLLARLNRELEATFDLDAFRHQAVWDAENQRIEMSLVSLRAQTPCVAGISIALAAGEAIRTEYCHKYTQEGFAALARVAGWNVQRVWTDPQNLYSLQLLESMA
jgi:dimethylhistidine N-methyltransferase